MEKLTKKQKKIVNEIVKAKDIIKGSISSVCSNCKRANCVCRTSTDKKSYRLTYKDKNQITKTVYVHKANLKRVKTMISNFEKVRKKIDELIEINILLLKYDQKTDIENKK